MQKIGLINIISGFAAILISASAGSFLGLYVNDAFVYDDSIFHSWQLWLNRSTHAHVALFGLIQIAVGLTIPYSRLEDNSKKIQYWLLTAGYIAMGPVLILKGLAKPQSDMSIYDFCFGAFISLFYIGILTHIYGLSLKLRNI